MKPGAEFFAEGVGWVPAEPTWANTRKTEPTRSFIGNDAVPFLIPCKLRKGVRKMLQQLGTLGGRQGPDRIRNLPGGAHDPIASLR